MTATEIRRRLRSYGISLAYFVANTRRLIDEAATPAERDELTAIRDALRAKRR